MASISWLPDAAKVLVIPFALVAAESRRPKDTQLYSDIMRKITSTSILSDAEIRAIKARISEILPIELAAAPDIETTVRFSAVATKCREQREHIGVTVKEAAARLRTPQYRVRAIENGHISEIHGGVLENYIALLRLRPWFNRWKRANQALARTLGPVR